MSSNIRGRDGPQEDGAPRPSFDGQTAATTPRQAERGLPRASSYITKSGQEKAILQVDDLARYPDGPAKPPTLIATYKLDPGPHFKEARLHLFGAPDDGRRAKMVFDLLWGRWAKPLEDPDTGDTAGIPAPVPAKPPGLTDGVAMEVQAPAA